jgi:hypothetical protein
VIILQIVIPVRETDDRINAVMFFVVAVITVICAPDDGWSYHTKYVEQFTEI